MSLTTLLPWIEGTAPARFLVAVPGAYPVVSAIHLLGIALLFGSVVPIDLRLTRLVGPQFDAALPSLIRIALVGFTVAASAGVLLASARIVEYAENPAFLTKMAILAVAGANALVLRLSSGARGIAAMVGTPSGKVTAVVSLFLWIAAVFAGRWIAFAGNE